MHRRRLRTQLVVLFGVVLLTVCFGGGVGVVGASHADGAAAVTETGGGSLLLQSETSAANSSASNSTLPPHRNPADIEPSGDIQQLEAVLRGSIDQELADSIENLDAGEYELAREQLGEEFEATLRQYVESAEEFDAEAQAELLSSLESEQEAYIDAVEAYNTSRTAYASAQQSGETARARELGRELIRDAERVDTTGERVVDNYRQLGNITGQTFSERVSRIEQRRADASETATTVTAEEFTATSLSVTANRSTVAGTDAVRLSGEIRTADGSSVGRQQAVFRVQDRRYTVEVAPDGSFAFDSHPASVWREADELRVSYRPADDTALLGSRTTLPLSVSATETRFRVDSITEQASYDQPVELTGRLLTSETGQPVPATPVSVRVGGTVLATTETAPNGTVRVRASVPADLAAGETTVDVGLVPSSRALTGEDTERSVRVLNTEPVVSLNATVVEGANAETRVSVDGRLVSPEGRPVAGEPVTVSVDGEAVGELTTDSTGAFTGQFAPPAGLGAGSEAVVEAAFESEGSNLNAASSSATVVLPETLLESVGLSSDEAALLGGGAVIGLLAVLLGAGWWLRQTPTGGARSATELDSSAPEGAAADSEQLLDTATAHLEAGADETAATVAYIAARRSLRETVDVADTATHWEWYRACAAAGVDQLSEIETLVEAFEQVTFAPDDGTSSDAASRAVSTARQLRDADQ